MERLKQFLWFISFAIGSAVMVFEPAYIDVHAHVYDAIPGVRDTSPSMNPRILYSLCWVMWLALLPFGTLIERSRTRIAQRKPASVLSGFIVGASYPVFALVLVISHWMDWGSTILFIFFLMALFNPITAYMITSGFEPAQQDEAGGVEESAESDYDSRRVM